MPMVNLTPIMTEIRKQYKGEPAIRNLRLPKKIGGKIDMILGINYSEMPRFQDF